MNSSVEGPNGTAENNTAALILPAQKPDGAHAASIAPRATESNISSGGTSAPGS